MSTSIGIEYAPHSLSEPDGSNGFHIVNLTIGEVETIRRALHTQGTTKSRELATALDEAMHHEPAAVDYHHLIGTPIKDL